MSSESEGDGEDAAEHLNELLSTWQRVTAPQSHATATNTNDMRGDRLSWASAIFCGLVLVVVVIEFHRQDSETTRFENEVRAELHDLRAWKDIHQNDINALKNERSKP